MRTKLATTGHLNPGEAFFWVHKELMDAERAWAIANNISYADVISAMDLNRQHLVTWVHLNASGNRIVADALAREILEQLRGNSTP